MVVQVAKKSLPQLSPYTPTNNNNRNMILARTGVYKGEQQFENNRNDFKVHLDQYKNYLASGNIGNSVGQGREGSYSPNNLYYYQKEEGKRSYSPKVMNNYQSVTPSYTNNIHNRSF